MSTEGKDIKEKAEAAKEAVEEAKGDAAEKVKEAAEKAKTAADEAKEKAKEAVKKADDKAKAVADEANADVTAVEENVKEDAAKVKEDAAKAKGKVKEAAADAKEKVAKVGTDAAAVAKKKDSNKKVAIIAVAICAVLAIVLFMMLQNQDNSPYGKIGDFDKYVKLGKYKGLTYTKEKITVSNKEVKAEIDNRLQEKATTKDIKKGTVKDGDNINISYKGTMNGKAFDGGTADNQTLTIGSGSMIKGFEEGLVDKKVGSTVTLKLKFPKDYQEKKLAGKKATFKVTINSKQKTETPKYDVKFIKANSDYDNKKDYEASIKKELLKSKEETAESTAKQTLWSEAVENSEVKKYPKGVVKTEQESIIEQYKQYASQYNMEYKDFLKQYMQTTEKEFNKQAKTYGETVAKQKLVLHAIAKKEGIKISNSEVKKRLKDMLKQANMTEDQFKEQYNMTIEKYAEENDLKSQFIMEEVNDFIYKNAKAEAPKTNKKK